MPKTLKAVKKTTLSGSTSDREIVITRVFDAPRERVFEAWADPEQKAKWWGPNGFSVTTREYDFKSGGKWLFTMHGPDGTDYASKSVFEEIVRPERIVYTHSGGKKGAPGVLFQATITFKDLGNGKTELTMRSVFPTAAERDTVVKVYKAIEGGNQTLARLAEHLAKGREFVISRVFNAPRERVWKAWTEPERLKQWFGPKGSEMLDCKMDLRPGGLFHYGMRFGGHDMWGKFVYREIVPMERIILVNSFSDAKGGITRHPMSPTWPLEMLTTTTFAERKGKTALTIRWSPLKPTAEERKTFDEGFESMDKGWTGTFEQLEAYLAKEA